jgi:A/G-specific adenine glycosylase
MMELGATICLRRKPLCLLCPVRTFCAAQKSDPEAYPKIASKIVEKLSVARAWCVRRKALLLHRAGPGARRLAGIYELPTAEQLGFTASAIRREPLIVERTRSITRFRITESIHAVRLEKDFDPAGGDGGLAWVPLGKLGSVALSGPHRHWVSEVLAREAAGKSAHQRLDPLF